MSQRSTVLAENVYEGMFILDSNRYGHDPEAVSGQVNEMIQKLGGNILVSRLWEERRLAYPIKSHRKGTYWLTYFRMPGTQLTILKRECQITESHFAGIVPEGRSADRRRRGGPCPEPRWLPRRRRRPRPSPRQPSWSIST